MLDEVVVFPLALSASKIQEQRDARYNLNDLVVKPGDVIAYTGQVENKLYGKVIDGLLFTDLPGGLDNAVPPSLFALAPGTTQTMTGNITVTASAQSGRTPLTQVAGGVTRDAYQSVDIGQPIVKMGLEEDAIYNYTYAPGKSATCSGNNCPSRTGDITGRVG